MRVYSIQNWIFLLHRITGTLQDYARTSTAAAGITRLTLFACIAVLVYGLVAVTAFL